MGLTEKQYGQTGKSPQNPLKVLGSVVKNTARPGNPETHFFFILGLTVLLLLLYLLDTCVSLRKLFNEHVKQHNMDAPSPILSTSCGVSRATAS